MRLFYASHVRDMNYCDVSGMKCRKRDRKEREQLAPSRKKKIKSK